MRRVTSRLLSQSTPGLEGLVERWATLAAASGAMATPGRVKLPTYLAFREESQRESKMQYAFRHVLLGEVREDRTLRILAGAYSHDAQFRGKYDREKAKPRRGDVGQSPTADLPRAGCPC